MSIELVIDAESIEAAVVDRDETISPHTEATLAVVKVEFRTLGVAARNRVLEVLKQGEVTVGSVGGKLFKVAERSHSYQDGSDLTFFTLTLEETEVLNADRVVLDGSLALVPTRYREEYRDGAILVHFVATPGADESAELEAMLGEGRRYFPVVSEGVRDHLLDMRFGQCLYQDNQDGSRTHLLLLVQREYDEAGDDRQFPGFNEPEISRLKETVASLQELVAAMVERLMATGTLSAEDAEAIRSRGEAVGREGLRQFDRVEDVHEHFPE